jgi:hypothetical protein
MFGKPGFRQEGIMAAETILKSKEKRRHDRYRKKTRNRPERIAGGRSKLRYEEKIQSLKSCEEWSEE